jgi:hypothetical protein
VTPDGIEALAAVTASVVAVHDAPITLEAAIAAGGAPIEACSERVAHPAGEYLD